MTATRITKVEQTAMDDARREAVAAKLWELLTSAYTKPTPWASVASAQKARYLEIAEALIQVSDEMGGGLFIPGKPEDAFTMHDEWKEEPTPEDTARFEQVKAALDQDRLSDRRLFE